MVVVGFWGPNTVWAVSAAQTKSIAQRALQEGMHVLAVEGDIRPAREGFTMIELMIVLAVITIIAAISVPNLLRSRIQANEAATVQNLRAILSAQGAHHSAHNEYATEMGQLVTATPPFLDHDFLAEPLNGYLISFGGDSNNYTINANAVTWGVTGNRGFFMDASGVIRVSYGEPADENSPPL